VQLSRQFGVSVGLFLISPGAFHCLFLSLDRSPPFAIAVTESIC
jgi:hypothetical protein